VVHDIIATRVALLLMLSAALAIVPPPRTVAAAGSCPVLQGIRCFSLTVPLDRAGALAGTIRLRAARIRSRRPSRPPIVGLTGGPGQAGLPFAESYDVILPTAGRDLVMFDQRGTGGSGLLRCRSFERRLGSSLTIPAGSCARSLGDRRSYYTSPDSADDLEALRARIHADTIALYAVSYGSRVALEYARRYPQHVERMILDSPVAPDGPDSLARETVGAVARVVRSACRSGCGGAAAHPVRDLAQLTRRLRRSPIRRLVRRSRHRLAVRVDADDVLSLLVTGDLDPDLLRAVPPAVKAALRGRSAALVRLKLTAIATEDGGLVSEFSPALFAATTCEESSFAWDRAVDPATRRAQAKAAIDVTPEKALAPFDRIAAVRAGLLSLCEDWPAPSRAVAPVPPLSGRIPTLVLSGDLDLRTPLEKARALVAMLPGAQLVVEHGVGHGVLGADPDGCAEPAVEAFLAHRPLPACRPDVSISIAARTSGH
jgi:pimeloyl-ACP methyl ester carboxylesterase